MTWMAYMTFQPKLTPFKTPAVTITAKRQKLTPFKTLTFYIGIDSFQDPYHFRTQVSRTDTPGSELSQTQLNSVISRPLNWIYTVFQSPWETTCKISMGDFLQELSTKLSTKWILDFFWENKEEDTSDATSQLIPSHYVWRAQHSAPQHSPKRIPFKTPKTSHTPSTAITV